MMRGSSPADCQQIAAIGSLMISITGNDKFDIFFHTLEGIYQIVKALFRHESGHAQYIFLRLNTHLFEIRVIQTRLRKIDAVMYYICRSLASLIKDFAGYG